MYALLCEFFDQGNNIMASESICLFVSASIIAETLHVFAPIGCMLFRSRCKQQQVGTCAWHARKSWSWCPCLSTALTPARHMHDPNDARTEAMSCTQLHLHCARAFADGLHHPEVKAMRNLGGQGRWKANIERDLHVKALFHALAAPCNMI